MATLAGNLAGQLFSAAPAAWPANPHRLWWLYDNGRPCCREP